MEIERIIEGKNQDGTFVEYRIKGKRIKLVVQKRHSEKKEPWFIYRVSPGVKGKVAVIEHFPTKAEAMGYAKGIISRS